MWLPLKSSYTYSELSLSRVYTRNLCKLQNVIAFTKPFQKREAKLPDSVNIIIIIYLYRYTCVLLHLQNSARAIILW